MVSARYKSDDVIKQREQELWEEYKEIKERVDRRKKLMAHEERRQTELMRECHEVLENPEASEEERSRAMRKLVHDPFKDLDEFLNPDEREELEEIKFHPEESPPPYTSLSSIVLLCSCASLTVNGCITG